MVILPSAVKFKQLQLSITLLGNLIHKFPVYHSSENSMRKKWNRVLQSKLWSSTQFEASQLQMIKMACLLCDLSIYLPSLLPKKQTGLQMSYLKDTLM